MSDRRPDYVLVVTYARSGSTLVQGMLNALPRTLVRGENNLILLPLYRSYSGLAGFQERFGGPGSAQPSSAFYGLGDVDLTAYVEGVHDLVQRQLLAGVPLADVDRLGFKEVLWHKVPEAEQGSFFGFLDEVFDEPRFVLNRRDVATTASSGFWLKRPPGVPEEKINRVRQIQDFLRESRPERCFDTDFEVLTDPDVAVAGDQLRRLAEFVVGECDDARLEALLATREVGHGPNPFGRSRGVAG